MSKRKMYGNRYIYRSNAGSIIQKPTNQSVIQQRHDLRDVIIKYAEYYEEQLMKTNEYDELEANALTMRWIDDTVKYYESNFADALDSISSYFEQLITKEESKKSNNSIQKIKVNAHV